MLVIGRGVRPGEINLAACRAAGLAVLARRSGGGPVLWDAGLLALDVVLPPGHPLAERDVTRAYAWLGTAVARALAGLGVPAAAIPLAEARAAQARTDPASRLAARSCFGGISPFEVVDPAGRKLVGLAQVPPGGGHDLPVRHRPRVRRTRARGPRSAATRPMPRRSPRPWTPAWWPCTPTAPS